MRMGTVVIFLGVDLPIIVMFWMGDICVQLYSYSTGQEIGEDGFPCHIHVEH